jgi:hypothetical protein
MTLMFLSGVLGEKNEKTLHLNRRIGHNYVMAPIR